MPAHSAVREPSLSQSDYEEVAAFEMPKPMVGQHVRYFPGGHPHGKWSLATVVEVGHQHVRVVSADPRANVTDNHIVHCDDPRIKSHFYVRKNGSWEFLQDFKEAVARNERINEALENLEQKMLTFQQRLNGRVQQLANALKKAGVQPADEDGGSVNEDE